MSGFSSKALLAALLCGCAAWAVAAPVKEPHVLAPSLEGSDAGKEEEAYPADNAPSIQMNDSVATPRATISESVVNAPAVDGYGMFNTSKGDGLPETIWKGSDRATMDAFLRQFHTGIANDALEDLTARLLATQATPPSGSGKPSWFTMRVNALIAIGQEEKAEQLLASLPASMTDNSLRKIQTELGLIRGEYDPICNKLQPDALPADESGEDFWHKLNILCKAHAGKQDEAMIGVDLMREEQHTDDLFFQEAIRKIGTKTSVIKANPKQWTLLNITLLRLASDSDKLKDRIDAFPPVALKYLAKDSSLDIKLREKATSKCQQIGILPGNSGNKVQEPPFARPLASDVTTLVTALGSGKPANDADTAVIARLAVDEAVMGDSRRIQRLLTLMEPFGYRVAPEVWQKLYQHPERYDGENPPASLISRMTDAAQAGRRGEAIVLAALVTGGSDIERASDLALLPVIKALIVAGYEKEARALAYDAVKSYSGR